MRCVTRAFQVGVYRGISRNYPKSSQVKLLEFTNDEMNKTFGNRVWLNGFIEMMVQLSNEGEE